MYPLFLDEFMTQNLYFIPWHVRNFYIFLPFSSKIVSENLLLSKWNILKPCINLMFKVIGEDVLISLHNQVITVCKVRNNSSMVLIKLMENIILGFVYN